MQALNPAHIDLVAGGKKFPPPTDLPPVLAPRPRPWPWFPVEP